MDGTPTDINFNTAINVPLDKSASALLQRMQVILGRLANFSQSCLETNGWSRMRDLEATSPLKFQHKGPDIVHGIKKMDAIRLDQENFDSAIEQLISRYPELDEDTFRAHVGSLMGTISQGMETLGSIDSNEMLAIDPDDQAYESWVESLKGFSDSFLREFNALGKYFQSCEPQAFPWITPIKVVLEVRSPLL